MKIKNIVIIAVIIVLAIMFVGLVVYLVLDDWDKRSTFGDMFGFVNALFSGLAFVGLIITLIQQKEELKLQREELAETRDELKNQ